MVDDYGGYKALFTTARQSPCVELGCWAHARRKFFDLHQANESPMALEALTRIGHLYHIEQQGKTLSSDARQQLRVEQSQPHSMLCMNGSSRLVSKPPMVEAPRKPGLYLETLAIPDPLCGNRPFANR